MARRMAWYKRLQDPRDVRAATVFAAVLLAGEAVLSLLIIHRVAYTEIDWVAYMQEVSGFLEARIGEYVFWLLPWGERDYKHLRGDTGPLVYPAGFVHVFSVLRWLTGGSIRTAQYVFAVLYLMTQAAVMTLYIRARSLPPWALVTLCLSRRLHSIFLLRLFNDCWAMLLAYVATLLLQSQKWAAAVVLYSAAVSVKMNVLLFAPGVLAVLIKAAPPSAVLRGVAAGLVLQVTLAVPFLVAAPGSYIGCAFELTRVFQHKWSVNWQFVPESWFQAEGGVGPAVAAFFKRTAKTPVPPISKDFMLFVVFTANLCGIVSARSLHYQFYSWYFHMLPFLLLRTRFPVYISLGVLVCIEAVWNLYPPSAVASAALQVFHWIVMAACWALPAPLPGPVTKVLGRRPQHGRRR